MRRCLGIIVILISFPLLGQNDIIFSHYMFNPTFSNPAFVGNDEISHLTFQVRSQWTGYSSTFDGSGGAPNSQAITASIPVIGKITGIGLIAVNDNLGPVTNMILNVPVSYQMEIGSGTLKIGLLPGMYTQIQKFDELRFNNPDDPFNVGRRESQLNFNLGLGTLYTSGSDFFVGLSALNILEPSFDYGLDSLANGLENKLIRTYNMIGGFDKRLNRDLSLSPSLTVRSDLNSFSFDLSAIINIGQKAWGGASYRWAEAVIFMFGYSFLPGNKLQLGYALDYVVDEQDAKQPTSQEIFLRYNIPEFVLGGRKQVKTPRFTH